MSRPEILFPLFTPVTRVRGVGPAMATTLKRILPFENDGLPIIRDLLFHLPVGLIDRRNTYKLKDAPSGETATYIVKVIEHLPPPRGFLKGGARRPYKVICKDETGEIAIIFFHAAEDYVKSALPVGEQRVISGVAERFEFRLQMAHPDIIAPVAQKEKVLRIEPVYPLTAGLTTRKLATLIQNALEKAPKLEEWIPADLMGVRGWKDWHTTLLRLHAPESAEDLQPGCEWRSRMAYDEILANQLHLALLRKRMQKKAGQVIPPSPTLRAQLRKQLPFTLTKGQEQVITEIDSDMASGNRMVRLLQGDVGSGKTVVALMAALSAVEAGGQVALMVPTELIAQQHAQTITRLTNGMGVKTVLLTGSVKGKARTVTLGAIASGEAQIVVGTHALFQDEVTFKKLTLMVVDEQHRFGVAQRMALAQKGQTPHLLQMTATPIPRSLTMTVYGDMDCSLLTDKPAERKPITTRVIPNSRMDEVVDGVKRALERGEKIYWICPQIEDDGTSLLDDVAAAEARYITFKTMFGELAGLVHGRIKADARDAEMQRFARGECRLLVATTVVEVGVDVRDATIIIIESADRFGLAQLHQLRGRVGRGDKASSCVLLFTDTSGEEARQRLTVLKESEDGFRIAEEDLRIRGGGDLLGTRQSGMPVFRFLSLADHQPLIAIARERINALLARDAALETDEGKNLRVLLALYGYEYGF